MKKNRQRMRRKISFFSLLWGALLFISCCTTVPYVDTQKKEASYPYKEILIQNHAKVEYVVLEPDSARDVIYFPTAHVLRIDKKQLIVSNHFYGDVFFFDRSGKLRLSFNCKGESDSAIHSFINASFWDAGREELWLCDDPSLHRILVYNREGRYLRTVHTDSALHIRQMLDYDDASFLVYDEKYRTDAEDPKKEPVHRNPFVRLSKTDGRILEYLPIHSLQGMLPETMRAGTSCPVSYRTMFDANGCRVFADMGSDTIYSYSKGKKKALLAKIPPLRIQGTYQNRLLVHAWTSKYVFLDVIPFDPNLRYNLVYDRIKNQFFYAHFVNEDIRLDEAESYSSYNYPGILGYADNTLLKTYSSDSLIAWDKRGLLSSKLREIVPKLKEDGNDVLMLISY